MVKSHLAGLVVAALVAGGGAAAWATESGPSSAPSTPAQPPAAANGAPAQNGGRRAGRPGAGLAQRAIHGDLIVRGTDGQFQNVTIDRGVVETKGDNSFTLKRPDGQTVTVKVDANTKYRGVSDFAGLQTGKRAGAVTEGGVAKMVAQPTGQRNANAGTVGT